ncbi:MAG: Dinucleotide-utilizing enzymes involved in molybdopterin and thiamine biosynthesis family 2 [bacterium]|nr:MAG: Dinucleotide-utilizing enzymes involved in molybdopterin and thiamine biosynthesis family 2 [bacterium]
MSNQVHIPTPLRPYAGGAEQVAVDADTVDGALAHLTTSHPGLKQHLFAADGKLRSFVNVYVNDDDIRYLSGGATPIKPGDVLTIVPSIAGGAGTSGRIEEIATRAADVTLSHEEIQRYSRHLIMPEVTMAGQKRLKAASVLMIGAGGLGSPLGLYLAAAGVGRLGIVDFDVVDMTNLQRQIIHGTAWLGKPKLESARARLSDLNPHVRIDTHETALTSENALELFGDYDVIVDGTDNFPTRYLVNDASVLLGKPNVYGSIFRFEGQASVFRSNEGPCYRCLYPEPPPPGLVPSCAEGGVLGILPGIIGVIQATETVKLILGVGTSLVGRLLLFDALRMSFRELKLRKNPDCPICGPNRTIHELIDYQQFCGITPHVAEPGEAEFEIAPTELKARMDRGDRLVIVDVREPHEFEISRIGGSRLIPLGQIPERMHELSSADEIILHCKAGLRSAKALAILRQAGFSRLKNLTGGIDRWAQEVDTTLPRY